MLKIEPMPEKWYDIIKSIPRNETQVPCYKEYWYTEDTRNFSILPLDFSNPVHYTKPDNHWYNEYEHRYFFVHNHTYKILTTYSRPNDDILNRWNVENIGTEFPDILTIDDIIFAKNYSDDVRRFIRHMKRKTFDVVLEPVSGKFREKLLGEKNYFGNEASGEGFWYRNYEKDFCLYPLTWVTESIVRCDTGEENCFFDII